MKTETKLTIQLVMAVVIVVFGCVLLTIGFIAPPLGEIHSSVLVAYGEVSTFAGALIGIDYHYRYRRHRDSETRNSVNQLPDDYDSK